MVRHIWAVRVADQNRAWNEQRAVILQEQGGVKES